MQLASTLTAVVAQRLVPRIGGGLVAVYEVLLGTSAVSNLIREGKTNQLRNAMQIGLARRPPDARDVAQRARCRAGVISHETAIEPAFVPARDRGQHGIVTALDDTGGVTTSAAGCAHRFGLPGALPRRGRTCERPTASDRRRRRRRPRLERNRSHRALRRRGHGPRRRRHASRRGCAIAKVTPNGVPCDRHVRLAFPCRVVTATRSSAGSARRPSTSELHVPSG